MLFDCYVTSILQLSCKFTKQQEILKQSPDRIFSNESSWKELFHLFDMHINPFHDSSEEHQITILY